MDEYDYNESIDLYEFKIEELKDQLALTEKAFELACDDIYWLGAFSGKLTKEEFISRKINYFKAKAKEMKSE